MEILDGLRYDAHKKEWVNGKIYDASKVVDIEELCAKLLQSGILKVRKFLEGRIDGKSNIFQEE